MLGANPSSAGLGRQNHLGTLEDKEATIVDLGTGPGLLAIELHKLWPRARIIGVDPSREMLNIAQSNAGQAGMEAFEVKLGTAAGRQP